MFVASEPRGRKSDRVDPLRDCRVSAHGLFDLKGQGFLQFEWYRGFCMILQARLKVFIFGTGLFRSQKEEK